MIEHTFCHIPTIGVKTEARLWEAGIHTWDDMLQADSLPVPPKSAAKLDLCKRHLHLSKERLALGDAAFFANSLPAGEIWRLFPAFRDSTAYVDIETTGLRPPGDHITTIALYNGRSTRWYVYERNLEAFAEDIAEYAMLVTFNGRCFDAPYIERSMDITLQHAHLDLRFALKAAGVKGGLKKIEKQFGLDRGELDGVDGYFAVLLWQEFLRSGDESVLETLLAYNIEDVLNLEHLAAKTYNLMVRDLPFGESLLMREPLPGLNPMRPDTRLIERLRCAYVSC